MDLESSSSLAQLRVRLLVSRSFKHSEKGLQGGIVAGTEGVLQEQERAGWWVKFSEEDVIRAPESSKKPVSLLLKPQQFTPVRPFSLIYPKLNWYSMGRDHQEDDLAFYVQDIVQPVKVVVMPEPTSEKRYCMACLGTFFNTICPKDGTTTLLVSESVGRAGSASKFAPRELESEIGTFDIVEKLASGYSADVFKAVRKGDGKSFAVKILQERFESKPNWLAGFDKEALALGQLSHPNIVKLHATGIIEKKPYHILDFIDGGTIADAGILADASEHKQLSQWFVPICDALNYMNAKGILHEDLKSSDIMIDSIEKSGKIIDLGKCRPIGHLHGTTSLNGAFSGNVNYTAPERCLGGSHYSHKANIYSLGCIFYECIAGVTPFSGGTIVQVAMKHLNAQVESLRKSHPSIKAELNDLILSMLNKSPNDRPGYEEIKAVLTAL